MVNYPADMRGHFDTILSKLPLEEAVTWERKTPTEGEMGQEASSSTDWSVSINILIQPITERDRDITALGVSVSGHMKAYARRRYEVSAGTYQTVNEGDYLTDADGQLYIVETVVGKFGGGSEIYRKLVLKMIDNA